MASPCKSESAVKGGAKWAREDDFPEMAEEMEKRVGISKGIEKIIDPLAPKRSHYHSGPEL